MEKCYEIFLSLDGEIIIKNNGSILIYKDTKFGLLQFFSNDKELHNMILFPLNSIPRRIWNRHKKKIQKMLSEK